MRHAATLLLTLLAITPSLAVAHEQPPERAVIAQVGLDRVDVLVTYREPPGERARLLLQRHDLNRDGKLDEAEQQLAQSSLGPLMLRGLELEVADERPGALEPRFKMSIRKDGSIEAVALMSYTLLRLRSAQTRTFHVRLQRGAGVPATVVSFQSIADQTLLTHPTPTRTLQPGQHASATFLSP